MARISLLKRIISLILLLSTATCGAVYSQENNLVDLKRSYLGFEAGASYSKFSAYSNFFFLFAYPYAPLIGSPPGNMYFDNPGSGTGYTFGISGELPLLPSNAIRLGLHYNMLTTSSLDTRMNASPTITKNSSAAIFESSYSSRWIFVGADLLFRQSIYPKSTYLILGADLYHLLSDKLDASQMLTSTDTSSQYISLVNQSPTGKRSFRIDGQTSSNYYNLNQMHLIFGIGAFIPISADFFLSPELRFRYPLSQFFSEAAQSIYTDNHAIAPKLLHLDLVLSLRYSISSHDGTAIVYSAPDPILRTPTPLQSNQRMRTMYLISGKVRDCKTKLPILADLLITDLDSNKKLLSTETGIVGSFSIPIHGPGHYAVTASARGYNFTSELYELVDSEKLNIVVSHEIDLCPEGEKIRLLVFFDYDNDGLKSSSFGELDRVVQLMKENPGMRVLLAAYTDSKGTDEYNENLSVRRADAVRNYLLAHRIDGKRIEAKGFGNTNPVASNETELGRGKNRRVEFVIVK